MITRQMTKTWYMQFKYARYVGCMFVECRRRWQVRAKCHSCACWAMTTRQMTRTWYMQLSEVGMLCWLYVCWVQKEMTSHDEVHVRCYAIAVNVLYPLFCAMQKEMTDVGISLMKQMLHINHALQRTVLCLLFCWMQKEMTDVEVSLMKQMLRIMHCKWLCCVCCFVECRKRWQTWRCSWCSKCYIPCIARNIVMLNAEGDGRRGGVHMSCVMQWK
jgi:hypothetical protein